MTDRITRRLMRYWDWRADTYDSQPGQRGGGGGGEAWESVWRALFPAARPLQILDVGAGTGFCSIPLARFGHRVTAADLSARMLARLREEATREGVEVAVRRCDAESIPEPEAPYDAVVARNLLWTLPNPEAAIRRWRSVLRSGGTLAVSDGRWNTAPRTFGRVADALRPGCEDRAGLRFERDYLPVRSRLPLFAGPDAGVASRLLRDAGFVRFRRWEHLFEKDPYGIEESGFFIVSCEKIGERP